METQTLTQMAQRIEDLTAYKDNLTASQQKAECIISIDVDHFEQVGTNDYSCILSDCKDELIPALIKVINKRIDDLKSKMNDLMYPLRQV